MDNTKMLEMFGQYEEAIENGTLTNDMFQHIKSIVKQCWNDAKYKPKIVSELMLAKEFINLADRQLINSFFSEAKIILTGKDKKRGKKGKFQRFKKRFHLKHVRIVLSDFLDVMVRDLVKDLNAQPSEAHLAEIIEQHGFDLSYWTIAYYLEDEHLKEIIERDYPYETTSFFTMLITFYITEEFDKIMDRPNRLANNQEHNLKKLKDENKHLSIQIDKSKERKFHLENTLKELKKEKERLNKDLNNLYEVSLKEIDQLKNKLKETEDSFETERQAYYETIKKLTKRLNDDHQPKVADNEEVDLKGAKICVIGGEKKRNYKRIVDKYNGKLRFIPVTQQNKIEGGVSESDVVFFLTESVGHQHFSMRLNSSKKYNTEFVFVNSLGMTSFERELKQHFSQ